MMGGTIDVESEYGKGSTFTIKLSQKLATGPVKVENSSSEKETTYDFSTKKILVVDDNGLNIKLAMRLFNKYNCKIDTAKSGFECIDLISKGNKYDIIFLDDVMPVMLGSETVTRLKRIEGFKTPVVSLTANAIEGVKEKYLNLGFDDYLAKPIEKSKLEDILVKFLVNKTEVKKIASSGTEADNVMGLSIETSNTGWLNNGQTSFMTDANEPIVGTESYVGGNSASAPTLLIYLHHSKNIATAGDMGNVKIQLMSIRQVDALTKETRRLLITLNLSRTLYDNNNYDGAMTAGRKYELFTSTATNISSTSAISAFYSFFSTGAGQ